MINKKDHEQVVRKFQTIRKRQVLAIAIALISIIVVAAVSKRPDLFGAFSKKTLSILLLAIILGFVNFSSFNWRCPSCKQYLGNDIGRQICRKCGVRLR